MPLAVSKRFCDFILNSSGKCNRSCPRNRTDIPFLDPIPRINNSPAPTTSTKKPDGE